MFKLLFFLLAPVFAFSQSVTNPYNLPLTNSIEKYQSEVSANPDNEFVDLSEVIPDIILDIRYATPNNFTHKVVYDLPKAFARRPVAKALASVQKELRRHGMGIKIFDAYRPYQATLKFWNLVEDTQYVAAPWSGSRHNRGAAIDLTLVILKTKEEIKMPTDYDDFSEKASPNYVQLPEQLIANRAYLIKVMRKHGFTVFPSEWWHFDFKHWDEFSLVDISFEQLLDYKAINK
ncbi:MAG: M15 family metallopeptidase [Bacteroidales bacterium]|nr:M15 family metallopeptidase [Bacteroidales bacterium]